MNAPNWVWVIAGIILILVLFLLLGHPIKIN